MIKPLIPVIAAVALLSACTERDMCLGRIDSELSTLRNLASTTQGNIDRGYALSESRKVSEHKYPCTVPQPDGSTVHQICTELVTTTEKTPVAIDLNAERAKLASLQQRIAAETRRVEQARSQCYAAYPQ